MQTLSPTCSYLSYAQTGAFSKLVVDYLERHPRLKTYYCFDTDTAGLSAAIEHRQAYPVNRQLLADTLTRQYQNLRVSESTARNIALLRSENTFTICTAHQPNLLTGYLYFAYKILHAIKLAVWCKEQYPAFDFVPVYYMGSEDNDLDELGTFRYEGKKFFWDAAGQTGAVGRMKTESLRPLLEELFRIMGPPGQAIEDLKHLLTEAYLHHDTIADATQYLVDELFGRFGLVIVNPDDAALKREFIPVMERDLIRQDSVTQVIQHTTSLAEHYKIQAHPRAINLFYLNEGLRERIEYNQHEWRVLHTDISWHQAELLDMLRKHPERFSPNVILRPLFQEMILPNIVFIGGGAEVAYWLQLKSLFEQHNVFFPAIHLRQSVLWIDGKIKQLRERLDLDVPALFLEESDVMRQLVLENGSHDWQTADQLALVQQAIYALREKAVQTDPTLRGAAEATLAKINRLVTNLEKKMLRAEKRKLKDQLQQVTAIKRVLFPGGKLQERVENFLPYYIMYGPDYFDLLLTAINPMKHEFLILENS